jgi:hypothetical protein
MTRNFPDNLRPILAGLCFVLLMVSAASAQISGEVQSIGFDGYYRGNCWTPMLIRVRNRSEQAQRLQIRVRQHDLDRDVVNYTRTITVSGGQSGDQRFWTYFIPQPTDGGLPSSAGGNTLADLQKQLQVWLYTMDGKPAAQLPITSMVTDVNRLGGNRGTRLILLVQSPGSRPKWQEYLQAVGLLEDVAMVPVQTRDLPEDVAGYAAADAVVWLNAPPLDARRPSEQKRFEALGQYVRQGGRLVICQGPRWRETAQAFGDMMPVEVAGMGQREDLTPLRELARLLPKEIKRPGGPVEAAKAVVRPDAVVDIWMKWPVLHPATTQTAAGATTKTSGGAKETWTPYIARRAFGMGSVTWVAQDLGDRVLTQAIPRGWPHIWDTVFDWRNASLPPDAPAAKQGKFASSSRVNLGDILLKGVDLPARSGGYIAIAVLFFIFYWAAAGPLSHLVLASKKRTGLSWFVFAAAALGATGLTVVIVQGVVRGAPRARHVTLVRLSPGEPAVVTSRIGLYIPHDGDQVIRLHDTAADRVSDLTPLPLSPVDLPDNSGYITPLEYDVPAPRMGEDSVGLTVPYRSTLKKLQARWVGDAISLGGIEGQAELVGSFPYLAGTLTNRLGRDLQDVYLAFRAEVVSGQAEERLVYLPRWAKGTSVDLWSVLTDRRNRAVFVGRIASSLQSPPGMNRRLNDALYDPGNAKRGWAGYWYGQFSGDGFGLANLQLPDDAQAMPMLSLFDLLPSMPAAAGQGRVDLLRRGARLMDASASVSAGQLLIVARDENPNGALSFPLTVQTLFGQAPVAAEGTTYYQIILPLQRAATRR